MLFQADHVAFSIFPVSSWAEIKAVCASQLADESVREKRREEWRVERERFSFPFLKKNDVFFFLLSVSLLTDAMPLSLSFFFLKNHPLKPTRRCRTSG